MRGAIESEITITSLIDVEGYIGAFDLFTSWRVKKCIHQKRRDLTYRPRTGRGYA